MSVTGLDVFDRTVHKTNSWLNDLIEVLGGGDQGPGVSGDEGDLACAAGPAHGRGGGTARGPASHAGARR